MFWSYLQPTISQTLLCSQPWSCFQSGLGYKMTPLVIQLHKRRLGTMPDTHLCLHLKYQIMEFYWFLPLSMSLICLPSLKLHHHHLWPPSPCLLPGILQLPFNVCLHRDDSWWSPIFFYLKATEDFSNRNLACVNFYSEPFSDSHGSEEQHKLLGYKRRRTVRPKLNLHQAPLIVIHVVRLVSLEFSPLQALEHAGLH